MDQIQKVLIKLGHKNLAQEYYKKIALVKFKTIKDPKHLLDELYSWTKIHISPFKLANGKWTEGFSLQRRLDVNGKPTSESAYDSISFRGKPSKENVNKLELTTILVGKNLVKDLSNPSKSWKKLDSVWQLGSNY